MISRVICASSRSFILSFLMVESNVFATPLSSCVTEWRQNARSGWMKSMWSFSHHLCTTNGQNSSCDGGHTEDAGCPKSLFLICILLKRSVKSPSLVSHCLSRSKNFLSRKKWKIILNPENQAKKWNPSNSKLSSCTSFSTPGVSRFKFHASGDACIRTVSGVKNWWLSCKYWQIMDAILCNSCLATRFSFT